MTYLPLQTINLVGLGVIIVLLLVIWWVYAKLSEMSSDSGRRLQKLHNDAKEQALEIISAATLDAEKERKIMKLKLDEISADHLRKFDEMLQNISKTVKSSTETEIKKFAQALEMETIGAQKAAAKKLEEAYDQVNAEIQEYKMNEMRKIENDVNESIAEITKEVLGKSIPISVHQDLIMEALKNAKKQHVV